MAVSIPGEEYSNIFKYTYVRNIIFGSTCQKNEYFGGYEEIVDFFFFWGGGVGVTKLDYFGGSFLYI